jgi:hypothetical protein
MEYVNENGVLDEWQPTIIAIICYEKRASLICIVNKGW